MQKRKMTGTEITPENDAPSPSTPPLLPLVPGSNSDVIINKKLEAYRPEKSSTKLNTKSSIHRDSAVARLRTEKKASLIKAWKDGQKAIFENKAEKKMSSVATWENSKRVSIEADIKKMEESFEKKKAECTEKLKNKIASVHKEAEERRAIAEAKKGEEMLKAEEAAAKFRAAGIVPKRLFGCFGSS